MSLIASNIVGSVNEENGIVKNVRVDDWTAVLAIIVSNVILLFAILFFIVTVEAHVALWIKWFYWKNVCEIQNLKKEQQQYIEKERMHSKYHISRENFSCRNS